MKRGISSAKLQGRKLISSWLSRIFVHPVVTAPDDPGRLKIKVPLARPPTARDWIVEVPISSNEICRKSSPKPSICLSNSGLSASGVLSLPVNPVPPVVTTTLTSGIEIHWETLALIAYISSLTMALSYSSWPASEMYWLNRSPDLSSASVRVSEMVSTEQEIIDIFLT